MKNLFLIIFTIFLISCSDTSSISTMDGTTGGEATPNSFSLTVISNAEINKNYTSNEIAITGIKDGETSLLKIDDGTIILNGIEQNTTIVTVKSTDKFAIQAKSSSDYGITKAVEVKIGSFSTYFVIQTGSDVIPTAFTFNDISNASLSTTYQSNTITISGLGNGISLYASIAGGTLIYNGTVMSENNVSVQNGNTLAITVKTQGGYSKTTEAKLSIGELSDTFTVTTYPNVSAISLSPTPSTIKIGNSLALTYTISPSNAPSGINYSTSDSSIATVNSAGTVLGISAGTATITGTSTFDSTKIGIATVNVVTNLPEATPTQITVTPTLKTLKLNESFIFDALSTPSGSSSNMIWGSSDPKIATVSSDGNVTAIAPGKATITAYSDSNMSIYGQGMVYVEVYKNLEQTTHEDTIGSVVDSCINSAKTTLWISDSSPGIKSFSINDTNLTALGTLDLNGTTDGIEIGKSDNYLYVADGYAGIKKILITTNTSPEINASYSFEYKNGNKSAVDIAVSADESKIIVATKIGVEWLNISNNTITSVDNLKLTDGNITSDVELTSDDKKILLASGAGGVRFYSVLGNTISSLGEYRSKDCNVSDVLISKDDKVAYVGCNTGIIKIIDFEDIDNIKLKGTYTVPEQVESMALSSDETKLYIGNGTLGIIVLDITFYDTVNKIIKPIAISAFNTVGFVSDIKLLEDDTTTKLFISDGGNGILILKETTTQ